jgi:hypothetical protein
MEKDMPVMIIIIIAKRDKSYLRIRNNNNIRNNNIKKRR